MHSGMQFPSPKRVHRVPNMSSDSDDSCTCTGLYSTLAPSRKLVDIPMCRGSKRMSPESSGYLAMSSPSSLGSEMGGHPLPRSLCGTPLDFLSCGALKELELERCPYELQSNVDSTRGGPHRIKQAKTAVVENESACSAISTPVRYWGDARNDNNGRVSPVAWMCGRDAASLVNQASFSWVDLAQPCLEDVYGSQWQQDVHPEDLARCKEVYSGACANREHYEIDYRIKIPRHNYRWIMDVAKPRFSNNRDFLGYVGWRVDIHQRKTLEDDFKQFCSLTHEILVKTEPDYTNSTTVSPTFPNLLGYTAEEFLQFHWMDLVHPEDKDHTHLEFEKCTQHLSVRGVQNRYKCKAGGSALGPVYVDSTGTYKWITWTADSIYGAGRDITAEKIVQEELRQSQAELRRITDAIPGGVFQCKIDDKGVETFPFVSKGALSLCGASSQPGDKFIQRVKSAVLEAYGDSFYIISGSQWNVDVDTDFYDMISNDYSHQKSGVAVHADDMPILREAMRQSSLTDTNLQCEYRVVQNEEVRWVKVHAVPQSRDNGRTKEWCGVTTDITDRHLLEEALREALDVAEKSNEAKGIFLANMSHEIRTPMNAVIGMGHLLVLTSLTQEQKEYVDTMQSSGEALLSIIDDILDFSKIEAGKMDLEVAPFKLTACIEESLDLIASHRAKNDLLELTCTVDENVPVTINGDASRVRQILVNLLNNAFKFTEQGYIALTVGACKLHKSSFLPSLDEGQLRESTGLCTDLKGPLWEIRFSVKDSGIGIPHDKIHTLFQAFSQVDPSTTRKYGGTGLGLAICARLCALWGGKVWVDSTLGQGSTFHVTLIAEETVEVDGSLSEQDHVAFLKGKRVLVIGGSTCGSQNLCARFFKGWDVRVVFAVTASDALHSVRQALEQSVDVSTSGTETKPSAVNNRFMAVVVDYNMAHNQLVMESLRLCQFSNPRVPLILLTPFPNRFQNIIKRFPVSFTTHLSKPVKESSLRSALINASVDRRDESMAGHDTEVVTPGSKMWSRQMSSSSNFNRTRAIGEKYPLTILIAEDDRTNQTVLLKLLEKHGYRAHVVDNGLEAVAAAKAQRYDVILMDCLMPHMDGMEATKTILRDVKPCPVVVAVTAAALEEEKVACQQAGLHMYIAKPIKAELLISTLYRCWQVKTKEIGLSELELDYLSSPRVTQKISKTPTFPSLAHSDDIGPVFN